MLPWGRLNIKMSFYQYRDSRVKGLYYEKFSVWLSDCLKTKQGIEYQYQPGRSFRDEWQLYLRKQYVLLGRGPEGSTMHPPPPPSTSLQNYIFLNPQSVHNKKWDVNSKNIGTHYWFTALF